jgi:hypothetical protein
MSAESRPAGAASEVGEPEASILAVLGRYACPDCGAVFEQGAADRVLRHQPGCPVAADMDAMLADDSAWFESQSSMKVRRRPPWWNEKVQIAGLLGGVPKGATWAGFVVLYSPAPGVRLKSFSDVRVFPSVRLK